MAETFAARVREVRNRRGWSQRELAERVTAAGRPMNASAVTKIEGGTQGVSLNDALVLAAVLGVAPIHMIVPMDGDLPPVEGLPPGDPGHPTSTPTDLTDKLRIHPPEARTWIRGDWPLHHRGPWNDDWSDEKLRHLFVTEAPTTEVTGRQDRRARWDRNASVFEDMEREAGRGLEEDEIAERGGITVAQVRRLRGISAAAYYAKGGDR